MIVMRNIKIAMRWQRSIEFSNDYGHRFIQLALLFVIYIKESFNKLIREFQGSCFLLLRTFVTVAFD